MAEATQTAGPSITASAASEPAAASSMPSAPSAPMPPVAELLPTEFDGLEAHTFTVSQDLIARLAAAAEVAVDNVETAYASEHGARFIQMLAIRAPDVPAERLLEVLPQVAYPPIAVDDLVVESVALAGQDLVAIHNPQMAGRLGTFYGFVRGGALIVVQTFERDAAEAAIAALPSP